MTAINSMWHHNSSAFYAGFFAILVHCSAPNSVQAQTTSSTVVSIADHLTPTGHPARKFVVQLAWDYAMRIGHLNQFEAFLRNRHASICNELCRDRVIGAYFAGDEVPGPSDLLRYVFTATCFGIIRSDDRMGDALSILQERLGVDPWYNAPQGMSDYDKVVIRDVIGNALKSYLKTDRIDDAKPRFDKVVRLWHATAGVSRPTKSNVYPIGWTSTQEQAARVACSRTTVDRRNAIQNKSAATQ